MPQLSTADHRVSPPRVTVPRDYNAAWDLVQRNLQAGRAGHGVGKPAAMRVNEGADVLAFFCWQLGVETMV